MLPIIAYIYAIGSLLCLAGFVTYELLRKPFARRIEASARFKFDPYAAPGTDTQQAARHQLTKSCRLSAEYQLAHHSLGRRMLEPRETER